MNSPDHPPLLLDILVMLGRVAGDAEEAINAIEARKWRSWLFLRCEQLTGLPLSAIRKTAIRAEGMEPLGRLSRVAKELRRLDREGTTTAI